MKFDTKKCTPVALRSRSSLPSSPSSPPRRRLNDRDLVWRNPNPYLSSDEEEFDEDSLDFQNDQEGNRKSYGRRIAQLPRLIYTPVKVSTRRRRSSHGSTETVTDVEMDAINTNLVNLNLENINKENDSGNCQRGRPNTTGGDQGIDSERPTVFGRISKDQVDPKTGKTIKIWRSTRVSKPVARF